VQNNTPYHREEVIGVIKQIERENYRDTSGGFELIYQVAKWVRLLPQGDRDEVISVLLHQLETGGDYGDLAPFVIAELADTRYIQQLLTLLPQLRKRSNRSEQGGRSLYDIAIISIAKHLCNEAVRTVLLDRIRELMHRKDSTAFYLMGILLRWGQAEDIAFFTDVLMNEEVRHLMSSENTHIEQFLYAYCTDGAGQTLDALLKEIAKVSEDISRWLSDLITTRFSQNPLLSQLCGNNQRRI